MHRFTVNLGAQFVDNHYGKGAIPDPWIVTEPSRDNLCYARLRRRLSEIPALVCLDSVCALHIKIEKIRITSLAAAGLED